MVRCLLLAACFFIAVLLLAVLLLALLLLAVLLLAVLLLALLVAFQIALLISYSSLAVCRLQS